MTVINADIWAREGGLPLAAMPLVGGGYGVPGEANEVGSRASVLGVQAPVEAPVDKQPLRPVGALSSVRTLVPAADPAAKKAAAMRAAAAPVAEQRAVDMSAGARLARWAESHSPLGISWAATTGLAVGAVLLAALVVRDSRGR